MLGQLGVYIIWVYLNITHDKLICDKIKKKDKKLYSVQYFDVGIYIFYFYLSCNFSNKINF